MPTRVKKMRRALKRFHKIASKYEIEMMKLQSEPFYDAFKRFMIQREMNKKK